MNSGFTLRLKSAQWAALVMYVISLATSMGGMEIFSTLLVVLWVASLCTGARPKWEPLPFWKPILAFVLIGFVGILLGGAPLELKLHDLGRSRFFLVYAVLFYTLRSVDRGNRWVKVLAGITFVIGIYSAVQHFIPLDLVRPEGKKIYRYAIQEEKIGPIVCGTFNHHLTFSNIYFFFACLFTAIGLYGKGIRRWALVHGLFLFLLCAWTQSRVAWIAIPVALLCLMAGKGKRAVLSTVVGLVVAGVLFYFTDAGFRERAERTLFHTDAFYSLSSRQHLWMAQFEFFKESPIWGVGANNNERRAQEVVDRLYPNQADPFYGHAHSEFLQILATTGLLGMLAFLWLWGDVMAATLKIMKAFGRAREEYWYGLGLFAAYLGFHIQGITQWNFGDAEVLHNVMFFWAVTATLLVKSKGVVGESGRGYN